MMSALGAAVCLSYMSFYLLALTGGTDGQGHGVKVIVKQDSDAVLPCSLGNKADLTGKVFDWKKDGQKKKEVFLYSAGSHYNNGRHGQDEQFKGRVSFYQDQLMNGNASIKIRNTKMADSGIYSCIFPDLQTSIIGLVVELTLRDRSGEGNGASPKPQITRLSETEDWALLQCEVQGTFPEPKVEWQDSVGNIVPAEEPQVLQNGGSYSVNLNTTVTKTDLYTCVATQEELSHQIHAKTFVFISEKPCEDGSTKVVIGWLGGIVIGAVVVLAVIAVLVATKRITLTPNCGPCWQKDDCEARRKQPDSL